MPVINAVLLVLIMVLLLIVAFRVSLFLIRRAMCLVIGRFKRNNAIRSENARTLNELGLAEQPLFTIIRDYKPYVLEALMRASIIQTTPDGRFYLSEERLTENRGVGCS